MQDLPSNVPRARAATVLVQQSVRRLPALPGLWKYYRLRFEPDHSGQIKVTGRWRHRPVDPAEIPALLYRAETIREGSRRSSRRSLARPFARTAGDGAEWQRTFPWGARLLRI